MAESIIALPLSDDQIDMILDAAKVPEPPEGWSDYDMQVARAIAAYMAEEAQAAVLAERERADIYRMERDADRQQKDFYLKVLVGINALLPSGPIEADGKVHFFNDPNANKTLRELKRRINAIEEGCAAANFASQPA